MLHWSRATARITSLRRELRTPGHGLNDPPALTGRRRRSASPHVRSDSVGELAGTINAPYPAPKIRVTAPLRLPSISLRLRLRGAPPVHFAPPSAKNSRRPVSVNPGEHVWPQRRAGVSRHCKSRDIPGAPIVHDWARTIRATGPPLGPRER